MITRAEALRTWSFDVADDASGLVVHELDAHLGNTSARTGSAKDASHLDELDGD